MDFWLTFRVVAAIGFVVALGVGILWWMIAAVLEFAGFVSGFDDLQLAYLISQEDLYSLTKQERKQALKMEYAERKAFLSEKFPNSIPAVKGDTLAANPN